MKCLYPWNKRMFKTLSVLFFFLSLCIQKLTIISFIFFCQLITISISHVAVLKAVVLNWQRELSSHYRPHGPGFSPGNVIWGGRGPGLCPLLPLPPVFLLAGDSGALCPDCSGSLWLHLHLHLPGGADHLRERNLSVVGLCRKLRYNLTAV